MFYSTSISHYLPVYKVHGMPRSVFVHVEDFLVELVYYNNSWFILEAVYPLVSIDRPFSSDDVVLLKHSDKHLYRATVSTLDPQIPHNHKQSWASKFFSSDLKHWTVIEIALDINNIIVPSAHLIRIEKFNPVNHSTPASLQIFSLQENIKHVMALPINNVQTPISSPHLQGVDSASLNSSMNSVIDSASPAVVIVKATPPNNDDYKTPVVDYGYLSSQNITDDDFLFFDQPSSANIELSDIMENHPNSQNHADVEQGQASFSDLIQSPLQRFNSSEFQPITRLRTDTEKYVGGGKYVYNPATSTDLQLKCSLCSSIIPSYFSAYNSLPILCSDCLLEQQTYEPPSPDEYSDAPSEETVSFPPLQVITDIHTLLSPSSTLTTLKGIARLKDTTPVAFDVLLPEPPKEDPSAETFSWLVDQIISAVDTRPIYETKAQRLVWIVDRLFQRLGISGSNLADILGSNLPENATTSKYAKFNVKRKSRTAANCNTPSILKRFLTPKCRTTSASPQNANLGFVLDSLEHLELFSSISRAPPFHGAKNIFALLMHKESDGLLDSQFKANFKQAFVEGSCGMFEFMNDTNIHCFTELKRQNVSIETYTACLTRHLPTITSYLVSLFAKYPDFENAFALILLEELIPQRLQLGKFIDSWRQALISEITKRVHFPLNVDLQAVLIIRFLPFDSLNYRRHAQISSLVTNLYNSIQLTHDGNTIFAPTFHLQSVEYSNKITLKSLGILAFSVSCCQNYVYAIFTDDMSQKTNVSYFKMTDYISLEFLQAVQGFCSRFSAVILLPLGVDPGEDQIVNGIFATVKMEQNLVAVEWKRVIVGIEIGCNKKDDELTGEFHDTNERPWRSFFQSQTSDYFTMYQLSKVTSEEIINRDVWKGIIKKLHETSYVYKKTVELPWPVLILKHIRQVPVLL